MIRKALLGVLGVIVILIIFYQIKAERYFGTREQTCCILRGKSRVSYKPIAIYYAQIVLFNFDFRSDEVLANNTLSRESNCPKTCKSVIGGMEQYLIASYFTENEKIELIKKYLPDSPLLN